MIIATRTLKLRDGNANVDVPVRIFAPVMQQEGACCCRYEIEWPHGKESEEAWGADAVQAIILTLQLIGTRIYTSDYHEFGSLFLDTPGRGYGFPLSATLRDLLIGDDKKFF